MIILHTIVPDNNRVKILNTQFKSSQGNKWGEVSLQLGVAILSNVLYAIFILFSHNQIKIYIHCFKLRHMQLQVLFILNP